MENEKHIKDTFCTRAKPEHHSELPHGVGLDIDYYQAFLDDVDISDDQKIELIETLWQIVVNFIEFGFQVHPLNLAQADGGQSIAERDDTARALERVIGDFASDAIGVLSAYENEHVAEGLQTIDAPALDVFGDDLPEFEDTKQPDNEETNDL